MLAYRESGALDRQAWDACIRRAGRQFYGYSWYLDRVCSRWSALVWEDYRAVFPLPWHRKLGVRRVIPPFFCQQLGIFSDSTDVPPLAAWLEAIPRSFRSIRLQLPGDSSPLPRGWYAEERLNLILPLDDTADVLQKAYDSNTRRNLKKAQQAGLNTDGELNGAGLSVLIRQHQGPKVPELRNSDFGRIGHIVDDALSRGSARMIRVFAPDNIRETLAAACFVLGPRGPVYLFGTSTPSGRENGAMVMAFDTAISEMAGHPGQCLDFEGSVIPGLERFYRGFGAVPEPYLALHMRRFPLVFKGF